MNLRSRDSYARIGPVRCPECDREIASLRGLTPHLLDVHPYLGQRDRALARDRARRECGWEPAARIPLASRVLRGAA